MYRNPYPQNTHMVLRIRIFSRSPLNKTGEPENTRYLNKASHMTEVEFTREKETERNTDLAVKRKQTKDPFRSDKGEKILPL